MRSSKELFHASAEYKAHFNALVSNPAFEGACNAALLGLVEELPERVADPSKSWDAYLQIVGARRVLELLSSLHVPEEKAKNVKAPEINYGAVNPKYRP